MHNERFVIDGRHLASAEAPAGSHDAQKRGRKREPAREQDPGALSDGMRSYILGYGGPVTAECTNPLGRRS